MINKQTFKKLLLLFIIIQPILDILTYFSIEYTDMSITIGIVARVLFMGISLLFIVFGNSSAYKKYIITYLIILFSVVGIGLVYNYFDKPIFDPFLELQYVAKTLYFSIMFCSYLLFFSNNDETVSTKNELLKAITIAMLIVSISMFVSILTGTASKTYPWDKFGFKGWFFSGNELGSIIAIAFPLVYLYALKKLENLKKTYYFIPAFLLAWSAILIGTKVGYFAVLGTVIITLVFYLIWWLARIIKKDSDSLLTKKFLVTIAFIGGFLLLTPLSPAMSNVSGDVGKISERTDDETTEQSLEEEEPQEEELTRDEMETDATFITSPVLKIILSSRNLYFADMLGMYQEADIVQKLFGMGYAGNYTKDDKTIEMDFFDLFFSFGIIGIIILLVPFLCIAYFLLKRLFTMPKRIFTPENVLLFCSVGMGTGIAFLAGHVIFAPAVAIYLALSMVLLLINMINIKEKQF